MGETNPVIMAGDTVWKDGDLKIVKWCGAFILYDTNPSKHLTMKDVSDEDINNTRRVESLKEYARGYRKGKREFQ